MVTLRRGGREVVGTDGDDTIDCFGYNLPGSKGVIVKAGDGNDLIVGSERDDQLFGGKGCDEISADEGNDLVDGGQDNDSDFTCGGGLFGGPGDDHVKGGPGDDDLSGGTGNDDLEGGPGDDNLDGDPDNDKLSGGPGDDDCDGDGGVDEADASCEAISNVP